MHRCHEMVSPGTATPGARQAPQRVGRWRAAVAALACVIGLAGCAGGRASAAGDQAHGPGARVDARGDPSAKRAAFAADSADRDAAQTSPRAVAGDARALLLGEVHDNPDGHRQRLALLAAEVDRGWRPAIAMEQFDRERQADLDRAMAACADADCVIRQAAPAAAGWDWQHYRPVIELALRHRLPLLAANVSRADAMRIVREGFGASLDAGTIAAHGLDRALPAALVDGQRHEITEGHCGQGLPEAMLDGMVRAQVARDVWMAKLVSAHAARGVVLLAGNGHVRTDYGVARWLTGPAAGQAWSVGFVEGEPDAPYDAIRMIQPLPRTDPCAGLRKPAPVRATR